MAKLEWYRPNVALVIEKNKSGLFLVCKRVGSSDWWQFPQGGVDENEALLSAAQRECYEEIGIKNIDYVDETRDWLTYDFPPHVYKGMKNRGWNYVGQKQKYFHMRFNGEESEIRFDTSKEIEFDSYKWVTAPQALDLVVDFKKKVYRFALTELRLLKDEAP